jgi:hypothetical protein
MTVKFIIHMLVISFPPLLVSTLLLYDDDDVYLDKLQTRGYKSLLYMKHRLQSIRHT